MKADAKECLLSTRLEALQDENRQLSRKLEVGQRKVKESMQLLTRARRGLVGRCALEVAWRTWRCAATANKDERMQEVLADKVRTRRLLGRIAGTWRRHTQNHRREALLVDERAAAETLRARLFDQIEREKEVLSAEVEHLKQKLVEEAQQRALLQENVQRVFMRGVCALNFEAMSLLKDGAAPGAAAGEAQPGAAEAVGGWGAKLAGSAAPASADSAAASTTASPAYDVFGMDPQTAETTRLSLLLLLILSL